MSTAAHPFDFDKARFNMIEQQVRPWEVLDSRVLELLGRVKREQFVPAAYQAIALADMEIPLSSPAVEGECLLAPKVTARCLQELAIQPGESVLEIGTGSGYMAAMLVGLGAKVVSIEINPALAQQAKSNLAAAGTTGVDVRTADAAADGFAACASGAPYDAIVLSGSVAEVPAELLQLLKTGGRLFAIVGQEPVMRATLVRRTGEAAFHSDQPWDINAPRLRHFPEPSRFTF